MPPPQRTQSAAASIPDDVLAVIFEFNGLHNLSGLQDRGNCNLVCRAWHRVLSQQQFQQAGRIAVGRFDNLRQLGRHLHRFRERHPEVLELEWHGHLRGVADFRKEEHLLQPVLTASWSQLRVLRLSDCAVSAAGLGAVGDACPQLLELRYRSASASYSPQHVSARSELVQRSHIMQIVQGCKQLEVLDVACHGSTPFAQHFRPSLMASIAELLPHLRQLTIFGRFSWDATSALSALPQLQQITLFGLKGDDIRMPHALPTISASIDSLVLEEFAVNPKLLVTVVNALPNLKQVSVSVLPLAVLAAGLDVKVEELLDGPDWDWDEAGFMDRTEGERAICDRLVALEAAEDMRRLRELSALSQYFQQPFGQPIAVTVRLMDEEEVLRPKPCPARARPYPTMGHTG